MALLMRNPDYGKKIAAAIRPEDFVTDTNRAIYAVLTKRIEAGRPFDPMSLSSELDAVQMSRLSYLTASTREQAFTIEDAAELIGVIREKQAEKTKEQVASMSEEELRSFIGEIAAKKNKGK